MTIFPVSPARFAWSLRSDLAALLRFKAARAVVLLGKFELLGPCLEFIPQCRITLPRVHVPQGIVHRRQRQIDLGRTVPPVRCSYFLIIFVERVEEIVQSRALEVR